MSRWLDAARRAEGTVENPFANTDKTAETLAPPVLSVSSVLSLTPAPDIDAFEERAAIAEYDRGMDRDAAERFAARAQGFESVSDLRGAAAAEWRRRLEGMAAKETSPSALVRIEAALRFVADGWAEMAAALGWPELELFGADPRAPWERLDRLGAAFSRHTPGAVTAEAIIYPGTGARPMRLYRGSQADGAGLAWEAER